MSTADLADPMPSLAAVDPALVVATPVELSAARDAAGLTLAMIAERLRIDPSRLAALESGDWEKLPSRAFARAALRSVAEMIGVNASPLIESVGNASAADLRMGMRPQVAVPVVTASMIGRLGNRRTGSSTARAWLTPVAAGVGALAVLLLLFSSIGAGPGDGGSNRIVSVPIPGTSSQQAAVDKAVINPSGRPAIRQVETIRLAGDASGGSLIGASAALAPAGLTGQQAGMSVTAGAAGKATAQPVDGEADKPLTFPVQLPPTEAVEVRFLSKAWVDISHKDGEKLLFGTQKAGKTVVLQGVPPMKVVIGNPDGVKMRFRGEPVDLKAALKKGVSRLVLN